MSTGNRKRHLLMSSALMAALAYGGAASAQFYSNMDGLFFTAYDEWDVADLIIDQDFEFYEWNDIDTNNEVLSEGALGASLMDLSQVAVASLDTISINIDAGQLTALNQAQDRFDSDYGLFLISRNLGVAATTILDATAGGSQIASSTFNTANVNIEAATVQIENPDYDPDNIDPEVPEFLDVDGVGELVVFQSLGSSDWSSGVPTNGFDEFDFSMVASNELVAFATQYGTAAIDSLTANPDFVAEGEEGYDPEIEEFINGVQQAAISLNTARVSSAADENNIVTLGQMVSAYEFSSGVFDENLDPKGSSNWVRDDTAFNLVLENQAIAFAPEPATYDNVDWRLMPEGNDPSVANLDQVAALSINTMTLGTAANEDEGIEASTANFDVWFERYDSGNIGLANTSAQLLELNVDQQQSPIRLGNDIVATSQGFEVMNFGPAYLEFIGDKDVAIGDVNISNTSQVISLTGNSISQLGEGTLTLKGQDVLYTPDPKGFAYSKTSFDQMARDILIAGSAGMDVSDNYAAFNVVLGSTYDGNVTVTGSDATEQVALITFNSISSGGDLVGWTDRDESWAVGIGQQIEAFSIDADYWNYARADIDGDGDALVTDFDQLSRLSLNSINVEGNILSNLYQETKDVYIEGWSGDNDWNRIDVDSYRGNAVVRDVTQTALASINTISAGENISGEIVAQYFDGEGWEVLSEDYMNELTVDTDYGNARANGVSQFVQVGINTLSGGDLEVEDFRQTIYGLQNGLSEEVELNRLKVESDDQGNARLANASQTGVLNLNVASLSGSVSGNVSQDVYDYLEIVNGNSARVEANDDLAARRWAGGNATISGLDQAMVVTVNSLTAGSFLDGSIRQETYGEIDVAISNFAWADADYGAAVADGVTQQAIARVNAIAVARQD